MTPRRINYFSAIKSSSSWPPSIDVITRISNNSLNVFLEMASSCCISSSPFSSSECNWKLLILAPSRQNKMRRRRCTYNEYFMVRKYALFYAIVFVKYLSPAICPQSAMLLIRSQITSISFRFEVHKSFYDSLNYIYASWVCLRDNLCMHYKNFFLLKMTHLPNFIVNVRISWSK